MTVALTVAALTTLTGPSADDDWLERWSERAQYGLTVELVNEYRGTTWVDLVVQRPVEYTPPPSRSMGDNSTDWTGLIAAHFPASQVATALRVVACESGGNPSAYNPSGASGLFQVMPFWADHFGIARDDLFAAEVNVAIARKVWDVQGWGAWACY